MSFKTDRLTALLPDAYGATETESLLYKLIDAVGAELMVADDKVKRLLKSHWVDYAEGAALDGLGAIYSVERRLLPDGKTPESDDSYRSRLRAVVPLFTGGGTVAAVRGAVKSVLGLPLDFGGLHLSADVVADLERLVRLDEFPLTTEQIEYGPSRLVVEDGADGEESVMYVDVVAPAVAAAPPKIALTMISGGAFDISLERLGSTPRAGARTKPLTPGQPPLTFPPGSVVTFQPTTAGGFSAVLQGDDDISDQFVGLDTPDPVLPVVPGEPSRWRFAAAGSRFDVTSFDGYFDPPRFTVAMTWLREQPLTFDLTVPWTPQTAVAAVLAQHGQTAEAFVFAGLGRAAVIATVDQTRAAGVRANLHFFVLSTEDHDPLEFLTLGERPTLEDAGAADALRLEGESQWPAETQDARDWCGLAGVFDFATFDGSFVFT